MRQLLDPISDIASVFAGRTTPDSPFQNHIRPREMRDHFHARGWTFNDYFRFVLVRNPWARQLSLYKMVRRWDSSYRGTFSQWLRTSSSTGSGGGGGENDDWRRLGAYTVDEFTGDDGGNRLVDEVYRLEDISTLPAALRKRGIPIPESAMVPWINRSHDSADFSSYYTPQLVKLVAERYAKDISEFRYRYPGERTMLTRHRVSAPRH